MICQSEMSGTSGSGPATCAWAAPISIMSPSNLCCFKVLARPTSGAGEDCAIRAKTCFELFKSLSKIVIIDLPIKEQGGSPCQLDQ